MEDVPKVLKDRSVRFARFAQLHEQHILPLTVFVEKLRAELGPAYSIPYFDPWDGGTGAEVLFLLEAPGDQAVLSGFISRNNPDETAKNFFELNEEAQIPRARTLSWNIVPWYVGRGNVNSNDVALGLENLLDLLSRLKHLRTVVLVGNEARKAAGTIAMNYPRLKLFEMCHPSPTFVNRAPQNRRRIADVLARVRSFLDEY